MSVNFAHVERVKRTGSIGLAAVIWHRFKHFYPTGLMKENEMNRMTAVAIYVALTASPGMFAHAQATSTLDAKPYQTQRAGESVIRCTHNDAGSRALHACKAGRPDEAIRISADVTRQEFECVLSGKCGVAERTRVGG